MWNDGYQWDALDYIEGQCIGNEEYGNYYDFVESREATIVLMKTKKLNPEKK